MIKMMIYPKNQGDGLATFSGRVYGRRYVDQKRKNKG